MDNSSPNLFSFKHLNRALAVGLFLLWGIVLLSPATSLWGIGWGVSALFGVLGFYLLWPFLAVLVGSLLILGTLKGSFLKPYVYLGFTLFFLGMAVLFSDYAAGSKESFAAFGDYRSLLYTYQGNKASLLYSSSRIGGGELGYALAALLNQGGRALLLSVAIVSVVGGFLLLAHRPLIALGKKIVLAVARERSRRASLKAQAKLQEEAAAMEQAEKENPPLARTPSENYGAMLEPHPGLQELSFTEPAPAETPKETPKATPEEKPEEALPSRSELYRKRPESPLPQAIAPSESVRNHPLLPPEEMSRSGLQEAVFIPDEATAEAYEAEKKKPVLDTNLSPSVNAHGIRSNEVTAPEEEVEPLDPSALNSSNEITSPLPPSIPVEPLPATPSVQPIPTPEGHSPSFVFSSPKEEKKAVEVPPTPRESAPEVTPASVAPSFEITAPSKPQEAPVSVTPVPSSLPSKAVPSAPHEATPVVPLKPAIAPMPVEASAPAPKPIPSSSTPAPSVTSVQPPANPLPPTPPSAPVVAPSPLDQCNQPKAEKRPPYVFPSLDLLRTYESNGNEDAMKMECQRRCELINETFQNLGVGAAVIGFTIGPSVTRYDIKTDADVSVSSVGRVIQDISVRLGGVPTRYEEIVRGKTTSGLEIVNTTTTIVSLKEMVKALPSGPKYNLYVPFGKSISGDAIASDLSDFPHMLVSGSTGSGKSIFMHGLIMSLIMRNRPEDLKLVVVDPKRVEMAKYKDLPHLLCPIIKEPSEAKVCFQKLIEEMERRYTLFELSGVSNIRQFNSEVAPEAHLETLPFIVVVVDEYADLVDSCKDIGDGVVRLAQKARAAGIHLVIATQRPSVNVITGTIKANLPVRVALSVSSAVDSQTILGVGGAEELAGHGDMLVDCSLIARNGFTRCQGCLVDNHEIKAVTDFIKSQAPLHYDARFLDLVDHEAEEKALAAQAPAFSKAELKSQEGDDLYNHIKEDIMSQEYTSISRIQRSYGVGFPRAGKIFARLQQEGIVANAPDTQSSSKGCKVLLHAAPNTPTLSASTDQSSVSLTPPDPSANGGNPQ